jgi:hypothetical protein
MATIRMLRKVPVIQVLPQMSGKMTKMLLRISKKSLPIMSMMMQMRPMKKKSKTLKDITTRGSATHTPRLYW